MASCLTTPTDHVRLHPLTELVHCGNAIPETLQATLEHQTRYNTYKYTYLHGMRGKIQPTYFQEWP